MEKIEFEQLKQIPAAHLKQFVDHTTKFFFVDNPKSGEFIRIFRRTITRPTQPGEVVHFESQESIHQEVIVPPPSNTAMSDALATALEIEPISTDFVQIDDIAFKFDYATDLAIKQKTTTINTLLDEGKLEIVPFTAVKEMIAPGIYLVTTTDGHVMVRHITTQSQRQLSKYEMIIPRPMRANINLDNMVPIQVRARHYLVCNFDEAIALLVTNVRCASHRDLVTLMDKSPNKFDVYMLEGSAMQIPDCFKVIGSINTLPRHNARTEHYQWWWDTAQKKFYYKHHKGVIGTIPRAAVTLSIKKNILFVNFAKEFYSKNCIEIPLHNNQKVIINEMNKREQDLQFVISPDAVYKIINGLKEQLIVGKYIEMTYLGKKK